MLTTCNSLIKINFLNRDLNQMNCHYLTQETFLCGMIQVQPFNRTFGTTSLDQNVWILALNQASISASSSPLKIISTNITNRQSHISKVFHQGHIMISDFFGVRSLRLPQVLIKPRKIQQFCSALAAAC